ncbi:MAG: ABC transporter ATP-binding protein [Chlamydiia bacterium]|nr:ABC transporter ATP-binding protein [Chlamydiia bacterium]MCP5508903.1 ABC transporter ATP-binding protein [Chlamydiales bacterium]
MKLLLKAALKSRKHVYLLFITFGTLILLTVASSLEMFSLGVLTDRGADFFNLFGTKKNQYERVQQVTKQEMETRWSEIDLQNKGAITKTDAALYMSRQTKGNPLNWVMAKLQAYFQMEKGGLELLLALMMVVAVFKAVTLFASRYATQVFSIRISRDLRQHYFEYIQYLPMSFYHEYDIGTLASRVATDASQIATSVNSWVTNYLHMPFTLISTFSVCFYLSWQLSLVVFIGAPLILLPIILLARKVKGITRQLQRNQERFTSVLIDFLAGIQTVKIFGMEEFSLEKYKEQNDYMAHLETKTAKYDLLTRPILHTITTMCLASVVLVGLYILHLSISELFTFCGFLYLIYEPIKKFAENNTSIQKGIVSAERLYQVLNIKSHLEDRPNAIKLKAFKNAIEFDNVSFRYEEQWVLKDVSFTVKHGETVAIVGATGAGKSTIVQLLPRLYDVQQGEIRIDGKPLAAYTQRSLRDQIAFVSQNPFLFYDTIAANIAFGRNFSKEDIVLAAQKAHAEEFIEQLPKKYDTMLAETGKNFSGGQQQRLAIARALVKKAPILILDEATSALDAISELRIKEAIQELHGEVTQILIAHRLTTIEHADRIIYLENGRKLAEGTKEELLETCLPFKAMWETHFRSSETLSV